MSWLLQEKYLKGKKDSEWKKKAGVLWGMALDKVVSRRFIMSC